MPSALAAPQVGAVLSRLYAAATHDSRHSSPPAPARAAASPAERSQAFQEVSFPVSAEAGNLLYALVRASRPQTVVEFGTSFGVSTIYLAAAVADNGAGHVVTTELSSKKVQAARSNLQQAGLGETVSVLAGDARETLAAVAGPVGLVLLDGWKDLFLPVIRLLEPKLAPGALVIANDGKLASAAAHRAGRCHVRPGQRVRPGVPGRAGAGGCGAPAGAGRGTGLASCRGGAPYPGARLAACSP